MSEKFTVWWVGRTTENGVNLIKKMFYDEKEAIKYAEKNGFEPPKKVVAENIMEEVALREQMHRQEESIKSRKLVLKGVLQKREDQQDSHKPIIDREKWGEVQEKIKERAAEIVQDVNKT